MGMTVTTTHIHNAQNLTKAQFKKAFTDMMNAKGYTASDEENAALTYTLAFSPDRKWVTVLTDGADTRREAAELAKALKMHTVMIDLVDSDFAELSLFDEAGAHKDTLTLGDSYLEDAAPMGDPAAWQPLLCGSWEQVQEIQNGSYTFAEDALAQFAPLIGMDSGNILLDNDSAANDNNAVVLHFKKAAEKKLTLNSAFVKVFGEALEPLGFVKVKTKERTLFFRLHHGDILQIITYRKVTSSKRDHLAFEIYGGIVSLYRQRIDLETSPETWLRNLAVFYAVSTPKEKCSLDIVRNLLTFHYDNKDPKKALESMAETFDLTCRYILPVLNNINSLNDCIEYFYDYQFDMTIAEYNDFSSNPLFCVSEGLLLVLANYKGDCKKWVEIDIANQIENHIADPDTVRLLCEEKNDRKIALRNKIQNTPHIKQQFLDFAESCKKNNIDYIRNTFKIDITDTASTATAPAKEKKLTLNSAFVKVFGEALEPLGFRKHKKKPIFIKLINDEIIQIVTVSEIKSPIDEYSSQRFNIFSKVETVYTENIEYSVTKYSIDTFAPVAEFYARNYMLFGRDMSIYSRIKLFSVENGDLIHSMNTALEEFKNYCIIPLNRINSLDSLFYYNDDFNHHANWRNQYLLCDDYTKLLHDKEKYLKETVDYDIEHGMNRRVKEKKEAYYSEIEQTVKFYLDYLNDINKSEKDRNEYFFQFQSIRKNNLDELRVLGIK